MENPKPVLWGVLVSVLLFALLPMWSVVSTLLTSGSTFAASLGGLGVLGMAAYIFALVPKAVKKFLNQL